MSEGRQRGSIQVVHFSNPDYMPPIINQLRLFARRKWPTDVLCREYAGTTGVEYPGGVRVRRVPRRARIPAAEFLAFIVTVLREADPEARVAVGHDMHGFLAARLLAWRRRVPVVYHCHDYAELKRGISARAAAVKVFELAFARTAAMVIVPDPDRAVVVARRLRLKAPPTVIPNAPLCEPAEGVPRLRVLLARHGIRFERIFFRHGQLGPGHAIEATLRSMPYWDSASWGFVVMGYGSESRVSALQALAADLGVEGRFVVLPPVRYDDVWAFLADADAGSAMYQPVHFNNVYITLASNKCMEYMAAGVPVILSDSPPARNLLREFPCGVTADESDPMAIARAVNLLLGDRSRARRMGEAGRRAFQERLCYDLQCGPLLDFLSRALQEGRPRPGDHQ